ncbi:MAG: proline--tRNA ligase [Candidatus Ozemobacteraceae bacterium]
MRMSSLIGKRFKEKPAEAVLVSHSFLLRGGYARQVANGIYSLLPPAFRVIRKIEAIIRDEMERLGGQEVLMPVVLPRELWEESGRYAGVGSELLRLTDRTGHDMLLAMTHEEGVVHLVRHEAFSYKQYPFMAFQIQTKFRDEPRSRGGLIRVREFTMKDAYSFHRTEEDLQKYYSACGLAYARIFARAGLPEVVAVQSDTGMMGGKVAHEYMLLCDAGEDTIVTCESCAYLANTEVAVGRIPGFPEEPLPLEKVHTPGKKTIEEVAEFLGLLPRQMVKAVFYEKDEEGRPVLVLIRGDVEVNEAKLGRILRCQPALAEEKTIRAIGAVPGYASGIGLQGCRIIVDPTVAQGGNLVCGANVADHHLKNFNLTRDVVGFETADIGTVREGDGCPQCQGHLHLSRGIEVGNIFQLGSKYTTSMKMTYLDEQGKEQIPIMGCYGIGVGRLLSSVMEVHHDEFGPVWPLSIAPWQVHLNALNLKKPAVKEAAEKLFLELKNAGIEVLFDDRDERAGIQFADADLLGIPLRFIIGERNLTEGKIEWKIRGEMGSGLVPVGEAVNLAINWIKDRLQEIRAKAETATIPF